MARGSEFLSFLLPGPLSTRSDGRLPARRPYPSAHVAEGEPRSPRPELRTARPAAKRRVPSSSVARIPLKVWALPALSSRSPFSRPDHDPYFWPEH